MRTYEGVLISARTSTYGLLSTMSAAQIKCTDFNIIHVVKITPYRVNGGRVFFYPGSGGVNAASNTLATQVVKHLRLLFRIMCLWPHLSAVSLVALTIFFLRLAKVVGILFALSLSICVLLHSLPRVPLLGSWRCA